MSVIKHKLSERKDDLYESPPEAVRALLTVETLPRGVWEPACGPGVIVNALRDAGHDVLATDLVDYGCHAQSHGRDFLMEMYTPPSIKAIITNPPYKLAAQFIKTALILVPKVYMLLPLTFWEAGNKKDIAGLARKYVLETKPPARCWVFSNRLPMMHRDDWDGPKATSTKAFAWFVWNAPHNKPTIMRRLAWRA